MTTLSNDVVAVLRRRAKFLAKDGFQQDFVEVFERAADELQILRRAAAGDATVATTAMYKLREMHKVLVKVLTTMEVSLVSRVDRERVGQVLRGALASAEQLGRGRAILGIEISPTQSRADIDALVTYQLDQWFATQKKGHHAEEARDREEGQDDRDALASDGSDTPQHTRAAGDGPTDQGADRRADDVARRRREEVRVRRVSGQHTGERDFEPHGGL